MSTQFFWIKNTCLIKDGAPIYSLILVWEIFKSIADFLKLQMVGKSLRYTVVNRLLSSIHVEKSRSRGNPRKCYLFLCYLDLSWFFLTGVTAVTKCYLCYLGFFVTGDIRNGLTQSQLCRHQKKHQICHVGVKMPHLSHFSHLTCRHQKVLAYLGNAPWSKSFYRVVKINPFYKSKCHRSKVLCQAGQKLCSLK